MGIARLLCHGSQTGVPVRSHQQNAQTVGVREVKAWVLLRKLLPKPMNTEIITMDAGVMKKYYTTVRQLRQPCFEIMFDCLVGVQTINVQ